ncbi:MAG: HEPN domain-containing protein [Leptolyngbya sp. UWPOB_LEPTO1]|uniref:HEPN domain-containing protein n=1 Tax=Leptolyngbya sp. UWPOB_LEPTO1 TaxID=2815653 RepID=UPI001AC5F3F0|nr:HEPN domain-containing protein [Leptolyngbya sp. UWPOB_LEPTO1]MBN8564187.1 HEPN domain-containing protein [Leptolyngbya sp. UWPOB_LEPTO1]
MSFDWEGYLTVAQTLFDEAEPSKADPAKSLLCEAKFRCCISRAYYSAFCLARNYLRDVEKRSEFDRYEDFSVHQLVIKVFGEEQDGNYRKISSILRRLRDDRNCADYDDEWQDIQSLSAKAKVVLKDARCIVAILQKLIQQKSVS